jgi:UDP-N-acetylmuramoyl-tripeptide--D-alanyl-D-alanine ligase
MAMYARGEIALLCDIARPHIGVVTNIGPVHLERLGSMEEITAAKGEMVETLPPDGVAVLNGDDPQAASLAQRTKARVMLCGTSARCDLRATKVTGHGLEGISFHLTYGEESAPVSIPLPGRHLVYPALAAAAVAISSGFTLAEAAQALGWARPPLRLRPLPGINDSTVLDDSYNASPASMLAALDLLSEMKGRRLALLGDMLELGTAEEEGHRQVGEAAARACDDLLLVGKRAGTMAEAARAAGLRRVRVFESKRDAVAALRDELQAGDHLLIKASRALALEMVVGELKAR